MENVFKIASRYRLSMPKKCSLLLKVFLVSLTLICLYKIAIHTQQKRARKWQAAPWGRAPFLHLIIQFPLLLNGNNLGNGTLNKKIHFQRRQHEYIDTLERNLKHPLVQKVHILGEDVETLQGVLNLFSQYHWKLELVDIGKRMYYIDAFTYASTVLASKTCVIMNADCFLGEGFEQINAKTLQNGVIYSLTRHETAKHIATCGKNNMCGHTSRYIGSHDAFVMNLIQPLPQEMLQKLSYRPNIYGVENYVILLLQKENFWVRNPCRILRIYHNHCVKKYQEGESFINGKRLEEFLKVPSGLAPFSGL